MLTHPTVDELPATTNAQGWPTPSPSSSTRPRASPFVRGTARPARSTASSPSVTPASSRTACAMPASSTTPASRTTTSGTARDLDKQLVLSFADGAPWSAGASTSLSAGRPASARAGSPTRSPTAYGRHGHSALRTCGVSRLFSSLGIARADSRYDSLARTHVLVLDHAGLSLISAEHRHDLPEAREDRHAPLDHRHQRASPSGRGPAEMGRLQGSERPGRTVLPAGR